MCGFFARVTPFCWPVAKNKKRGTHSNKHIKFKCEFKKKKRNKFVRVLVL